MSDNKIPSLKELAKNGVPDAKPLIPTIPELDDKGGVMKSISSEEMNDRIIRAFDENGKTRSVAETGALLGREMMKTREDKLAEKRGIQPNFDEYDIAFIQSATQAAASDMYEINKDLTKESVEILLANGYTPDQIDSMPFFEMNDTAMKLKSGNTKETTETKLTVQPLDLSKPLGYTNVEKNENVHSPVTQVELLSPGNNTNIIQKENNANYEEEDFKEVPMREIIQPKNVYVKYTDKPRSGYALKKDNAQRKLLARQKRGKSAIVHLPNSNITLEIFEMKQPQIIKEVVTDIWISRQVEHRRKTLTMILERSNILASDGDDITVEGALNFISVDDIPYIYLGACLANSIDKVPMGVICDTCGSQLEILIDVEEAFVKMTKELEIEATSNFNREDTFQVQVSKSNVNKSAVVVDNDARATATIRNPSIEIHLRLLEYTKRFIIEKYQTLIPRAAQGKSIDIIYQSLLETGNTEIASDVTMSMLLAYVENIRYYSFDAPDDNWEVDNQIDEEVSVDKDGIETTLLAIQQLETSTIDKIYETIQKEFLVARYSVTSGAWKCSKCGNMNDSLLEGLELLMNTLQIRMDQSK